MKICKLCLKSDMLCNACNKKVESGEISRAELDVSRALNKIEEGMEFSKVVDAGRKIIILCDKSSVSKIVGRGGRNAKKLEKELKKNVKVIGTDSLAEDKNALESLFNAPVIGINILYSGGESYRIRIEKKFERRIGRDVIKILDKLFGKKAEVVFE